MMVDIKRLLRPTYRRRTVPKGEDWRALLKSILDKGILNPIVVRRTPRHFRIVDGDIRYMAALALGYSQVPVRVVEEIP